MLNLDDLSGRQASAKAAAPEVPSGHEQSLTGKGAAEDNMSEIQQAKKEEKKPVYFIVKDPEGERGPCVRDLTDAKELASKAGPEYYIEVWEEQDDDTKPVRSRVIRQEDFNLKHASECGFSSETRIAFSFEGIQIQMYYNSRSDRVTVRLNGMTLPTEKSIIRNPLWTDEKLVDQFLERYTSQELQKIYEEEHEKYLKDWQQWKDDVAMRRI